MLSIVVLRRGAEQPDIDRADAEFLQRLDVGNVIGDAAGEHPRLAVDRRARLRARAGQHAQRHA